MAFMASIVFSEPVPEDQLFLAVKETDCLADSLFNAARALDHFGGGRCPVPAHVAEALTDTLVNIAAQLLPATGRQADADLCDSLEAWLVDRGRF